MTVTSLPVRDEYTATAGQTIFNYTFLIFTNQDLDVYITPSGQAASDSADLTTAYTVDAGTIGNPVGGFITLNVGASAGDLITVVSSIAEDRTTDYQNSGDFLPDVVDADFDRVVSLVKQQEDRASRTLSFPASLQNATNLTMPLPEAGLYVKWKADALGLENTGAPGQIVPSEMTGTALQMVASSTLSAGDFIITSGHSLDGDGGNNNYLARASTAGPYDGFSLIASVGSPGIEFVALFPSGVLAFAQAGVVGDNVADDTDQMQAVVDFAIAAGGGVIECLPDKTYLIDKIDFTGANNVDIRTRGAVFRISNALTASSLGVKVFACDNFTFDQFVVTNSGGYEVGRDRLIRFDNCTKLRGGSVSITYDSQHLPESSTVGGLWTLEGNARSIMFSECSDVHVGKLSTLRADVAIRLLDCIDMQIDHIYIDTFMKGIDLNGGRQIRIGYAYIWKLTPTFEAWMRVTYNDWRKDWPGNNGILVGDGSASVYTSVLDLSFGDITVRDSGEHGVRIGGDNDRERITFESLTTLSTGGMGLKLLGSDTTYIRDSSFGTLKFFDCFVDEEETLAAVDGATQFVFANTGSTITLSGISWPESFGGDVTTIVITGSTSNNNTYTINSRDSDSQITVSGASVVNETDAVPNTVVTWVNEFKVSHAFGVYNVRDIIVGNVMWGEVSKTYACEDGIQFHDAAGVTIGNIYGVNAKYNGISIRASNGGTSNDCRAINIQSAFINSAATGLYLNHEQITLDELAFKNLHIQNCDDGIIVEDSGGTPGTISNNVLIQAHMNDCTRYYTSDKDNILLNLTGDADGTLSTSARNGSSWQVSGSTLNILKAGTWTAL